MAKDSLGGEIYALGEMADHMLSLEVLFGPFEGIYPGVLRWTDCESLFTRLKTRKTVTTEYLVRHVSSIQQLLGAGDLENAYWLPGAETATDGLTKVQSDVVPLLRLLESGRFCLGRHRPPKGAARKK